MIVFAVLWFETRSLTLAFLTLRMTKNRVVPAKAGTTHEACS